MKQLVLLLKPLEEFIVAVGMRDTWRQKLLEIVKGMQPIFPADKVPKCSPPNSLLESYLQISLIADETYNKTQKIRFEYFYRLFMVVKNQLQKQEANALVMAKIIRLASQITSVPAEHKDHFYRDFGAVVN